MSFFVNLLGSLIFGAVGWLITHLIANPLLTVWRLRAEVPEVIFKTANVGASGRLPEEEEWKEARDLLRGLAARIIAANAIALPFVRWSLLRGGIDLQKAAQGLTGLSNSITATDGSRALHRAAIERALRLPRTDSDEYIRSIEETLRAR